VGNLKKMFRKFLINNFKGISFVGIVGVDVKIILKYTTTL
jgi:hypothetical protein